jgi:hypothetical protein
MVSIVFDNAELVISDLDAHFRQNLLKSFTLIIFEEVLFIVRFLLHLCSLALFLVFLYFVNSCFLALELGHHRVAADLFLKASRELVVVFL